MTDRLHRAFDQLHDSRPPPRGAAAVLDGARRPVMRCTAPNRRPPGRPVLAGLAVACACLVVFMAWPSNGTTVTTGPAGVSTTTAPTTAPAGNEPALAPGRHFGYLRAVDGASHTIEFDEAIFLSGDAAAAAARRDGVPLVDGVLPNDLYIVNDEVALRTLRVRPDVAVKVIRSETCCEHSTVDFAFLARAYASNQSRTEALYGGGDTFLVTVAEGGAVSRIEHAYTP